MIIPESFLILFLGAVITLAIHGVVLLKGPLQRTIEELDGLTPTSPELT